MKNKNDSKEFFENVSPNFDKSFDDIFNVAMQRVVTLGDTPFSSLEEKVDLLSQLRTFKLGRFLLEKRGLNGYWADYTIRYIDQPKKELEKLESFILRVAPITLATRERFKIFQEIIQLNLQDNIDIASVPCGLMSDLLTLDYRHVKNVKIIGIDVDYDSLLLAHELSRKNNLEHASFFIQADAWETSFNNQFDILVSHGLNFYKEETDESITSLFDNFFKALKPGGILLTSFRTPTPAQGNCPWNMDYIDEEYLRLQYVVLQEVINARWVRTNSCKEMADMIEKAGFSDMEIIYDRARMFPTIIAKKG